MIDIRANLPPTGMTLLHAPGRRLAKLVTDTEVLAYDSVFRFDLHAVVVSNLDRLHALLAEMLHRPSWCIVRGAIQDPARTNRVRRLLHFDPKTGDVPTLESVRRSWLAIDLDHVARPEAVLAADLAGCARLGIATLPAAFHGVRCIAQASASHGIKPGVRLRLWYWLDRPASTEELKAWLPRTDTAIFVANQPIYSAAPVFETGLRDHLPNRLLMIPGEPVVAVPDADVLLPPKPLHTPLAASVARGPFGIPSAFNGGSVQWVIDGALQKLRCAPEGTRHHTLFRQARLVGGVAARLGESDEALARHLIEALPHNPGHETTRRKTALDGLAAGRLAPLQLDNPPPLVSGVESMAARMIARRGAQA